MKETIGKSFAWSFLEQGGSKAIALIVQIVLARLLAPEAFGLLAIMLVVVDVATVVAQSGLGMALIQSPDADTSACTTAFWLSLGVAAVLYLVVFLAAPAVAALYGMPDLCWCLRAVALSIPLNAVNSIQRSLLQKDMGFKAIFKSNTSAILISGVAGIAAAALGWGVWALVVQTLAQATVACVAMALQVDWRPSFSFDAEKAKGLFSYGWKICLTGILNVLYTGVSELIIGKACGAGQLGYYSQGRKWPNAGIHVASNALQNVMFPAFSSMQDDRKRLQTAIRKAIAVGCFIMVPISLVTAVTAESIVVLLLGEKWIPCVLVFRITCAGSCGLMLQLVNLRAYMALGDSGLYLKLQIIKVVASCAIIWTVAVLTGNIYWTAFATSTCGLLCIVIVDLAPAQRMHGVGRGEQLRLFAPVLAAALPATAAAATLMLLNWPHAVLLPAQIIVFAIVYAVFVRAFRVKGAKECFEMAKRLVSSKQ